MPWRELKPMDLKVMFIAGHHALHPEPVDHALGRFRARLVEAEERAAGEVDVQT